MSQLKCRLKCIIIYAADIISRQDFSTNILAGKGLPVKLLLEKKPFQYFQTMIAHLPKTDAIERT